MLHRIRNRAGVSWRRWELWWQDHGEEAEKVMVAVAFAVLAYMALVYLVTHG